MVGTKHLSCHRTAILLILRLENEVWTKVIEPIEIGAH